jgi:hypothetical protein
VARNVLPNRCAPGRKGEVGPKHMGIFAPRSFSARFMKGRISEGIRGPDPHDEMNPRFRHDLFSIVELTRLWLSPAPDRRSQ